MKWVDTVPFGEVARSTISTRSIAVGEPEQRTPITMASYLGVMWPESSRVSLAGNGPLWLRGRADAPPWPTPPSEEPSPPRTGGVTVVRATG